MSCLDYILAGVRDDDETEIQWLSHTCAGKPITRRWCGRDEDGSSIVVMSGDTLDGMNREVEFLALQGWEMVK